MSNTSGATIDAWQLHAQMLPCRMMGANLHIKCKHDYYDGLLTSAFAGWDNDLRCQARHGSHIKRTARCSRLSSMPWNT